MTKTLVAITAFFAVSFNAQAVELINEDGSDLSQICIATAKSDAPIYETLHTNGINSVEARSVMCNGEPVVQFAKKIRAAEAAPIAFTLEATDAARETQLCVAAATSNKAFADAKARLFANKRVFNVQCNGMKLAKFAKRHGNTGFNG